LCFSGGGGKQFKILDLKFEIYRLGQAGGIQTMKISHCKDGLA
jgi:hypothetical protein